MFILPTGVWNSQLPTQLALALTRTCLFLAPETGEGRVAALLVGTAQTGLLTASVGGFLGEAYHSWEFFLGAVLPSPEEKGKEFPSGASV